VQDLWEAVRDLGVALVVVRIKERGGEPLFFKPPLQKVLEWVHPSVCDILIRHQIPLSVEN